ncbi:hypothetical protein Tco_1371949 [Tanacetum coccineum]
MADKETKSTMKEFATNGQADYYSGITSITVNGKNAYELKRKFLDDLHKNAFSGTNGEDAVEHIEYFLKIVDPIDLLNVNKDKLRVVVFPISLAGDAWIWFDGIKGSITNIFTKGALWDYWKLGSDEIEPTNEETSDLEETNHDNEQEISEIFRIETNLLDYETPLCEKFKEFNYLLKIDPNVLTNNIIGFNTYEEYKDKWIYEWNKDVPWVHEKPWTDDGEWKESTPYEDLKDSKLKDEALRNKAIMEGLINEDDESNNDEFNIRRFEMIKYSLRDDEEYVAVKEDEYDDLTSTSKDACRAYQGIFRMMDEGWMVTCTE